MARARWNSGDRGVRVPGPALEGEQAIQDQAAAYRKAGIPGTMDQLRNRAMLDRLRGLDARGPEFVRLAATGSGPMDGLPARINMIFPFLPRPGSEINRVTSPGGERSTPGLVRELAARAAADKRTAPDSDRWARVGNWSWLRQARARKKAGQDRQNGSASVCWD